MIRSGGTCALPRSSDGGGDLAPLVLRSSTSTAGEQAGRGGLKSLALRLIFRSKDRT